MTRNIFSSNLRKGVMSLRITLEFEINKEEIYKDKNRIFLSWLKFFMNKYDNRLYRELYENGALEKDYTFSLYLKRGVKFERETILVPEKKIIMHFSCYDLQLGLSFYNIFMRSINVEHTYKDLIIKAVKLNVDREEIFTNDYSEFKTASPIIVREHKENNNNLTYFHDISTERGQEVFLKNLKAMLIKKFGEEAAIDIDLLSVEIIKSKMVTVRHYDINIPANLCALRINAKPYLLKYIYLSGNLSSMSSSGFGMLTVIKY